MQQYGQAAILGAGRALLFSNRVPVIRVRVFGIEFRKTCERANRHVGVLSRRGFLQKRKGFLGFAHRSNDRGEIFAANVEGTRAVMQAARNAGVERVVYTSSVATLAVRTDGTSVDETFPLDEAKAIGAYKRSKVIAERLVERMIAEEKLPAVIVNPSTPIGPRDVKPTPTGRIIVEAASGRMPAFVDTGLNMVHVDDVAEGHVLAFERGRIGERYVLGGQNASLAEILATVAETVGRRPPRIRIPRKALMPFAHVSEAVARVTGREPMLTLDGLRMSKNKMFFSSAKAERELGYRARPYRAGITDAVAWFRSAGYLR